RARGDGHVIERVVDGLDRGAGGGEAAAGDRRTLDNEVRGAVRRDRLPRVGDGLIVNLERAAAGGLESTGVGDGGYVRELERLARHVGVDGSDTSRAS